MYLNLVPLKLQLAVSWTHLFLNWVLEILTHSTGMISKSIDATRTLYSNSVVGIVLFYKSLRQYFYVKNETLWPVAKSFSEASEKNKNSADDKRLKMAVG